MATTRDLIQRLLDKFAIVESAINKLIPLARSVFEQSGRQGEVIDALPGQAIAMESVLREMITEIGRWQDEEIKARKLTYDALLLIYGQRLDSVQAKQLFDTVKLESDKIYLARRLSKQVRNLNDLKEQIAMYAGFPPVHLLRQAEDAEAEIERLKGELNA